MPTVKEAALTLARELYQIGCYEGLGRMGWSPTFPIGGADGREIRFNPDVFVGLSVQAVGHEVEAEDPRVHLYALRASKKVRASLPQEIGGFPLMVHSFGRVQVTQSLPRALRNQANVFIRNGIVACGSSCAPATEQISGTLGGLVRLNNELCCISNNHVFSGCNHVQIGIPIISPAAGDTQANGDAPREIARHETFVEIRSGIPDLVPANRADLAIAKVPNARSVSSWQGSEAGYDTPTTSSHPITGQEVKKIGRTSGLTYGVIQSLVSSFTIIPFKYPNFTGKAWFTNFFVVAASQAPFALPGDSGSLIVSEDGSSVLGVLSGATSGGEFGLMIPWSEVQNQFHGISLVGEHNVNEYHQGQPDDTQGS
jgi:hypothetical protein